MKIFISLNNLKFKIINLRIKKWMNISVSSIKQIIYNRKAQDNNKKSSSSQTNQGGFCR